MYNYSPCELVQVLISCRIIFILFTIEKGTQLFLLKLLNFKTFNMIIMMMIMITIKNRKNPLRAKEIYIIIKSSMKDSNQITSSTILLSFFFPHFSHSLFFVETIIIGNGSNILFSLVPILIIISRFFYFFIYFMQVKDYTIVFFVNINLVKKIQVE